MSQLELPPTTSLTSGGVRVDLAVLQRFPVDRTGLRGRKGMATSLLDDGIPLLLFPEGTRSRTGEMGAFKPGAAALCISRDVPCVPVGIVGAS